jgi:hypothetical protein
VAPAASSVHGCDVAAFAEGAKESRRSVGVGLMRAGRLRTFIPFAVWPQFKQLFNHVPGCGAIGKVHQQTVCEIQFHG